MITERRLAKVETSLTPREVVLRWLAEAQEYPSLVEHARSILDLPDSAAPLSQIGLAVETAVRDSRKGQPRETVETAVRRAVGDAVFLFVLVVHLNATALDIARLEGLRAAGLTFSMNALLGDPLSGHPEARAAEPDHASELHAAWRRWRAILDALIAEVRVEGDARASLELRYLGGQPALFEDAAQAWAGLQDHVERLARLAELLPPAIRAKAPEGPPDDNLVAGIPDRAAARARTLADDARIKGFELLGDRSRAVAILERRLRASTP